MLHTGGHSDSLYSLEAHDVLQKDGDGLPLIETYGCAIIASMWTEDYHKNIIQFHPLDQLGCDARHYPASKSTGATTIHFTL